MYKIEVKETLSRIIEVNAASWDAANSMVREAYAMQSIVLGSEDFVGVEFNYVEELKGESNV